MERLAQETLQHAFSYLSTDPISRTALSNVRLVNRHFAVRSARCLFNTVSLWLGLTSLENLANIADHPVLKNYVRNIHFSTLRFIEYGQDPALPESHMEDLLDWKEPLSENAHMLATKRYVHTYRYYIEMQRGLAEKDMDLEILTRALMKLNKFRGVLIGWNDFHIGSVELIRSFQRFQADQLVTWEDPYPMQCFCHALARSRTKISELHLGYDNDESMRPHVMNLYASQFIVDACVDPSTLSPDALSPANPYLRIALSGLKKLEISPGKLPFQEEGTYIEVIVELGNAICNMQSLESLILGCDDTEECGGTSLKYLIHPDTLLPKLRVFDVHNLGSSAAEMIDFLKCHAATLEDVQFIVSIIGDASWQDVLTGLRTTRFPRLKRFMIASDIALIQSTEVHDFLLHKTDKNPFQECAREEKLRKLVNRLIS